MKNGTVWPLCRDCRFYGDRGECLHVKVKPENLVTGARPSAWAVREYPMTYGNVCGTEGRAFQSRDVRVVARVVPNLALPNPWAQISLPQRVLTWINDLVKGD